MDSPLKISFNFIQPQDYNFSYFFPLANGPVISGTCDVDADSGRIQSVNYPNDYRNNEDCFWRITVPIGSTVILEFETPFDVR